MTDSTNSTDELRNAARHRLQRKAAFRNYLLSWALVTVICVAVWALTSPGQYFWPIWPFVGMGIGAASMAFGMSRDKGPITDAQVDAEVQRMQGK